MWLFTTVGFFSIVQKPRQSGLTIRAWVATDLDSLRETLKSYDNELRVHQSLDGATLLEDGGT